MVMFVDLWRGHPINESVTTPCIAPHDLKNLEGTDIKKGYPVFANQCAIRMGTALFGKVYRIVTKWYGNAVDEAFDDAIYAWRTGYFEGRSVFSEPDASDVPVATPELDERVSDRETGSVSVSVADEVKTIPEEAADPNTAGIRIDLSAIGGAGR